MGSNNQNSLSPEYQQKQQTGLARSHHPLGMNEASSYYYNLKHYTPICYRGQGAPMLLSNEGWQKSLACLAVINVVFAMVIFMFATSDDARVGKKPGQNMDSKLPLLTANIGLLFLINLTFFLTQFLNPGIKNPEQLTQQNFRQDGSFMCFDCKKRKTGSMIHCDQCQVCLEGLDHHCGFFGKCIAGRQKYSFFAFLTFMFLGFLCIIVTLTYSLGI